MFHVFSLFLLVFKACFFLKSKLAFFTWFQYTQCRPVPAPRGLLLGFSWQNLCFFARGIAYVYAPCGSRYTLLVVGRSHRMRYIAFGIEGGVLL